MKKSLIGCALALVWMVGAAIASSTPSNFSGTWVLDKSKSDGLPRQLQNVESYTMVVAQNDKQLTVENKIVGGARAGGEHNGGESNAPRDRSGQGGQGGNGGGRRGGFGGQGGGQAGGQGGGRGGRGGMG